MLLKEIRTIFHKELDALYPKEEVDSFFYMLLEHYLGLERFVLAMEPKKLVSKEEEQPLFEGLSELKLERPIQHIIGKTHFFDMEFKVNKNVLIPRPETEELVQWILMDYIRGPHEPVKGPQNAQAKKRTNNLGSTDTFTILDIGTGSGCIAVALAKNFPQAKVIALDVSIEALAVAKLNALSNNVEIEFVHADILKIKSLGKKFDIIISNPPYVRELEKENIHRNVKKYEPGSALFVSDDNSLVFYEHISKYAADNLKNDGALYLEINQYLGKETCQLLKDQNFLEIELRKDMFGNDRMLKGVKSKI